MGLYYFRIKHGEGTQFSNATFGRLCEEGKRLAGIYKANWDKFWDEWREWKEYLSGPYLA